MRVPGLFTIVALGSACMPSLALATGPADFIAGLEQEARQADPAFKGFSASRGQTFFAARHGAEWSCSSCHTDDPLQSGKHARTGKSIAPLSPNGDAQRFTSQAKVDKWFKRNCNDVLGRACTAQEKGDVLTWLVGLKR